MVNGAGIIGAEVQIEQGFWEVVHGLFKVTSKSKVSKWWKVVHSFVEVVSKCQMSDFSWQAVHMLIEVAPKG